MALDAATALNISSTIRFVLGALLLFLYFKGRYKSALYFGLFFVCYGLVTVFRSQSVMTGDLTYFLFSRLALAATTLIVLLALKDMKVSWISNYKIVPIFILAAAFLSYRDTYILLGPAGEANPLNSLPSYLINSVGLFLAAYYFSRFGSMLPDIGRKFLVGGFVLQGLLVLSATLLLAKGMLALAALIGLVGTTLIGLGFLMIMGKMGNIE